MNESRFRFRAWDKASSEMRFYDYAGILQRGTTLVFDVLGQEAIYVDDYFNSTEINNYVLMQFTGLLDKNGKEIYEGDLIQNAAGRICEVTWHQFTGQWDATVRVAKDHGVFRGFEPRDWLHAVEVIGNVYENQELIK